MKLKFDRCRFDRVQNLYIAIGISIGATMGVAEGNMGMWLGIGAAIGLLLALSRTGRSGSADRDGTE